MNIAIDPAAKCGIAWLDHDGRVVTHHCGLLQIADWIASLPAEKHRVFLERPPKGLHGAAAVIFAGNLIVDEFRRVHPRRCQIEFVNPSSWQAAVRRKIGAVDGEDSKGLSRRFVDGHGVDYDSSQDACDAAAILLITKG